MGSWKLDASVHRCGVRPGNKREKPVALVPKLATGRRNGAGTKRERNRISLVLHFVRETVVLLLTCAHAYDTVRMIAEHVFAVRRQLGSFDQPTTAARGLSSEIYSP